MAENKTKQTKTSVTDFLNSLKDESQKRDAKTLVKMLKNATGAPAKMWGPSIVGFGKKKYKYESGREGEWMLAGFSPRKGQLVIYFCYGHKHDKTLLSKLGKSKSGASCLYIKNLDDIDLKILEKIIKRSL